MSTSIVSLATVIFEYLNKKKKKGVEQAQIIFTINENRLSFDAEKSKAEILESLRKELDEDNNTLNIV